MMTMPTITRLVVIPEMAKKTAVDYKKVHAQLTAITLNADSSEVYEAARQHLQTIEDADGDALTAAIATAKDWLKTH